MDPENGRNENNEGQENAGQQDARSDETRRAETRRDEAQSDEARSGEARRGRRRRRGLLIGGAVLGVLLLLTVGTVALVLVVGSREVAGGGGFAGPSDTYDEEYVLGEGGDKIAAIPVEGAILSADVSVGDGLDLTTTPEGIRDALRQAEEDQSVVAVVLEVDSPGGEVTASDQIYEHIRDFRESSEKPVVVSMGPVAASGGYYISAAADEILAEPSTITGSLGVIFALTNFSEAAEDLGIEQEIIKSGEFKDIGSSFRDLTEEEREIFRSLVEEDYDQFVDVIVAGTDLEEERVREIADGRIYSGRQALELGLVDELGGLEEATGRAQELAGVEEARVVRYVLPQQFTGFFPPLFSARQGEVSEIEKLTRLIEDTGLTLDGGKPYYLYLPGL